MAVDRSGNLFIADSGNNAIRKGVQSASKHLIEVPMVGNTVPHMVIGRTGSARVMLKPASPGTGVIAGPSARAVLEAVGVKDILTKSATHPHGIKVRLVDGQVGRVQKIDA